MGYVAEELAIGLSELGPTACKARRHITSRKQDGDGCGRCIRPPCAGSWPAAC
ncbi:MAG: hypothetical protein E4H23_10170 [Chrysiogenales bacterium]|nr:MAG: hypothetical protein E4H23_10170 [Chrysiogenales bacterium]